MRIRYLNKKEKQELYNYFINLGIKIDNNFKKEEIYIDEEKNIYFMNKKPIAFKYNDIIVPHLKFLTEYDNEMKYIKVDEGAIKYILNGADVFRPGIKEFSENINKNDLVLILSPDNSILGIGLSLLSSEELKKIEKGKCIINLHYINDKYFNIS